MPASALRPRRTAFTLALLLATSALACGQPAGPVDFDDLPIVCSAGLVNGPTYSLVTRQLFLPQGSGTHRYTEDYDGNGKHENAFRNVTQLANIAGINLDTPLAATYQRGENLLLLELTTPSLSDSECARLTIRRAQPPSPGEPAPRFDGQDRFQPAPGEAVTLYGRIRGSVLKTIPPRQQAAGQDIQLSLPLPLLPGAPLLLPLRGLGLWATLQLDERGQLSRLSEGALHGAMSAAAASSQLAPAIAGLLTEIIHSAPPTADYSGIIKAIEDPKNASSRSKCQVATNCCAISPRTCQFLPAEILESPIGGVLQPDVEVFDASQTWRPLPGGRQKNGFTTGLGFEAVRAQF